jgi:SAM-dependent methyltransferase
MTTLPPGRLSLSGRESHEVREVAESFGADADRYDRARPTYPDAMVRRILAGSRGVDVLDVGCGTGIAARLFAAAGCRVLGVDPDERMAELARRRGLEVDISAFEQWDPAGRSFDTVIAAQAWHWIDPVAGAKQAARALRPAGRLAVFWNAFEPPPDLGEAFADVFRRVLPDVQALQRPTPGPRAYEALSDKAADGMRQSGAFAEPERWQFDWEQAYTRDEWLDQVPTMGLLTRQPSATIGEVLAGIGAAIDAAGGSFLMRYATVVVTARRTV